jgi:hypothetical protein
MNTKKKKKTQTSKLHSPTQESLHRGKQQRIICK